MSLNRDEPRSRLKVLFLAQLFPWPLNSGARQRLFHLARGLASGHDLSLVALGGPATTHEIEALRTAAGVLDVTVIEPDRRAPYDSRDMLGQFGQKIDSLVARIRSPLPPFVRDMWSVDLTSHLNTLRRESTFDIVYANRSWMAEHARAAGFPRIVVDVDDLVSPMLWHRVAATGWHWRTSVRLFDAAKSARYERSLTRRFDHVVVAKAEDRTFFRAAERNRVVVIPNGVAIPQGVSREPSSADTILFVGTLGYGPNIDAVRWFASTVMPRIWASMPHVRFVVAGLGSADPFRELLGDSRIEMHESPADLGPLYDAASLVVAPIRMGGGTRIKILEALARGRAVVSTTFAAEGLDLRGGVELELADSPEAIASVVAELLSDPERRQRMAANGRDHVSARFDWRTIERSLPVLLERFASL